MLADSISPAAASWYNFDRENPVKYSCPRAGARTQTGSAPQSCGKEVAVIIDSYYVSARGYLPGRKEDFRVRPCRTIRVVSSVAIKFFI